MMGDIEEEDVRYVTSKQLFDRWIEMTKPMVEQGKEFKDFLEEQKHQRHIISDSTVDWTSVAQQSVKDYPNKPFTKYDNDKPDYSLIPPDALRQVVEVLTLGAKKYSRNNWHKCDSWARYYSASQRHLWAFWNGEDLDPETQKNHLSHSICCLLFLLELTKINPKADDRTKPEVK